MNTHEWAYLHAKPNCSGQIKQQIEDFQVVEKLGYSPIGEGEHIYLWVRKKELNTAYVAEHIAKFCKLPLRAVTYAGRKDKHATTEQWFGVHKPGKAEFNWTELKLPGLEILTAKRHNKKLRTGVLKANEFKITVRDLSDTKGLEEKINAIAKQGVPNYFGQQRFGNTAHHPNGGNLALAEKMINGESIRNRNKRSMAISAMRSWLFNQYVSERIKQQRFRTALPGDVCLLSGSNSFFIANEINTEIETRLQQQDILLSAPMWGDGTLDSEGQAKQFEQSIAEQHSSQSNTLSTLGLKQDRRAIRLFPKHLKWHIENTTLTIQFELTSGAFATSVLREIVNLTDACDADQNTA